MNYASTYALWLLFWPVALFNLPPFACRLSLRAAALVRSIKEVSSQVLFFVAMIYCIPQYFIDFWVLILYI